MTEPKTYRVEEIFPDFRSADENVTMTIPPEILEEAGLKEGDTVKVKITEDGDLTIEKATNGER